MICENCNTEHDGSVGSGRFCSIKCSRSFSTKLKRSDINQKVSEKLKGIPTNRWNGNAAFQDPEVRAKAVRTRLGNLKTKYESQEFATLPKRRRKSIVLNEQNHLCLMCGISETWNNLPLIFHLDHIDGNHSNNSRDNLRTVCPNCHSQTSTYAGRNAWKSPRDSRSTIELQE